MTDCSKRFCRGRVKLRLYREAEFVDLGLTDRVALVTGAAGGIGAAVAEALACEGCHIALIDVACDAEMQAAAARVGAHGREALRMAADVRRYDRATEVVDQIVTRFGRLDILVCCAGITRDGVSWKMPEPEWDDVLAVNLKGCFNYAHAAIPVLRQRGSSARIVNIASINGMRGKFGQANYAASKAGIVGLSKTLAREVGRFGITVNVVAPGMVDTAMTRALPEAQMSAALAETVLGRICVAADVADTVVFLCSERARQITGEVIRVDAGQYI